MSATEEPQKTHLISSDDLGARPDVISQRGFGKSLKGVDLVDSEEGGPHTHNRPLSKEKCEGQYSLENDVGIGSCLRYVMVRFVMDRTCCANICH